MAEKESSREDIQDHYRGHEIDIETAEDRFSVLEGPAQDVPTTSGKTADDDTEAKLGPKEPEMPNDPYCTC